MNVIQERICRVANRMSTAIGFVEGSTDRAVVKQMFLDGFTSLETLLLELNQSGYRDDLLGPLNEESNLAISEQEADEFAKEQSDLLHQAKLHERMIANVVDHLVTLRPEQITAASTSAALAQLEYIVTCEAEVISEKWHTAAPEVLQERFGLLRDIANGLAVIAVNVDSDSRFKKLAVTYGAFLMTNGLASTIRNL